MKKSLSILAFALFVMGIAFATAVVAAAPWTLFGKAMAVKEGVGNNPWAIDLSSKMTPGDWNSLTYSGVAFYPDLENGALTFQNIYKLSADYKIKAGGCGGGSPRFQINVDGKSIFVYIGPIPNFTGCPLDVWQNTGNLIESSDARFDLSQLGGPWYGTYAQALALAGSKQVTGVQLVTDSGWVFGQQDVLVDNVTVNDSVLSSHGFRPAK